MLKAEIQYHSTRGEAGDVNYWKAMMEGLAPDQGLYLPTQWPDLSETLWNNIQGKSIQEIGRQIARAFISDISDEKLDALVTDALSFDAPLRSLHDDLYVLELFYGPTLAFKDFGARFMARLMSYQALKNDQKMVILVATSGDTGSAVGQAFEGVEGIDVCLLYPSGKVSKLQEQQLTTIGNNVTALEVDGTFDDCQKLVKDAFADQDLRNQLVLSSANSINIGRLLPQMFYYGRALAQLEEQTEVHFCVPSGNFGNLTAGMMAAKTGMPARQFLAGTNVNDVVPEFLREGTFTPRPSQNTISSAMDVGNPSNLERIRALFTEMPLLKNHLWATSFDDNQTREAIAKVYQEAGYTLDPHTAVGYLTAQQYKQEENCDHPIVILSTAHPAKFSDIVEPVIDANIELPPALKESMSKDKKSIKASTSYPAFKSFLLSEYV
ncbi:threonine synthase [Fodinibius salsisoli]|uniref:Threonine synthase n=1 Tax=Fodinibius salsisoli TaxID=2820877 RepID=A0ABT3PSS6_9BACT|nr:threonine synthase [Fodinibius salsisoli]MCW9708913.1 threonine synthase [Fodinibius salsisoli]